MFVMLHHVFLLECAGGRQFGGLNHLRAIRAVDLARNLRMRSLGNPQNQAANGGGLSCPFVRSGQSASFHDRPDFSADAIKHHFRWFGRRGGPVDYVLRP